jgi:hypothetical protein
MAAPAGNQFWKARSSHGRKPIFSSAEELWEACSEYFQWVEDNPLFEDKLVTFQGAATHEPVAKMRAMTIGGLCIFLDISQQAWSEYRQREGFGEITTQAEQIIRQQKFQGAAADLLNANIIARDLGLSDKTELTGKDGGPIETRELSDTEAARRIAFALAKGAQNT